MSLVSGVACVPPDRCFLAALDSRDFLDHGKDLTAKKDLVRVQSFAIVVRTGKNPILLRAIGIMFTPETKHLEVPLA